jgi:Na+/melibiose symporter-like transporter
MLSAATYSIALASIFPLPRGDFLATVPVFVVCGMAASGFQLTISAMLGDVGDDIRLAKGKQLISLVYAVNGLASKIAAAFSIGITFPLLQALGYNPRGRAFNTPASIHNLELSYLIGPILFVMLGAACVIGWRIDAKRHAEIREQLEARDAALEAELAWPEPVLEPSVAQGAAE